MKLEGQDVLQRIAEGMNTLPESDQKYILGFAEGALAAANRPYAPQGPLDRAREEAAAPQNRA